MTAKKKAKKKAKRLTRVGELEWDYCECGCKCFTAKGTNYSIFMRIVDGKEDVFILFEGYWYNQEEFKTYEAAKKAAGKRFKKRMGWIK